MGTITEGGNYCDPEGGLYVSAVVPPVKVVHTTDTKTKESQSPADVGTQASATWKKRPKSTQAGRSLGMPDE